MQSWKGTHFTLAVSTFMASLFIQGLMLPASAKDTAALVETCAACHGADGQPLSPEIPNIWGQNNGYIYLQLRDMKAGNRKNELMAPIVADLSKDDMVALAAYFSAKPWPDLKQANSTAADTIIGQNLDISIGCTACHGADYKGDSTVPRLAAQSVVDLQAQLAAFRSGARANNPGMTALMQAAQPEQLQAMARYLAGL